MDGLRHRKRSKGGLSAAELTNTPENNDDFALPTSASLGIFFGFLLCLKIIVVVNQRLPTFLKVADEIKSPERFIGERAENDLLKLVALGPKVTGSYECEVLAVRVLRQEIAVIAQTAHPMHLLQQDLQRPKGSFHMALKPHGFQSIYENIQNIAVRLGPRRPSNNSILINCHFDTVPESPGASDNGLNCAVMLEVLRKMSRLPERLKHNIIFLFNGAEENVLQAAHGFITKHHWSKEVRVVINLDAAGAGGREFLFQASPDHQWLLRTYARSVPRPSASLAGQELFNSGLIPSDTDFRIFRDFGHIPGIDMAHVDNGYIYHTRLDTMEYIAPGVYQHTGDNLLALLYELANAPELSDVAAASEPGVELVYFDLFGAVMFVYSHGTSLIINLLTAALGLYAAWKTISSLPKSQSCVLATLATATLTALASVVLGFAASLLVALVLDRAGATMVWYAKPAFIVLLYVLPYVAAALVPWTRRHASGMQVALEYFCGGHVLTTLVLLAITLAGIRSSYLLMILVLFPAIVGAFDFKKKSVGTHLGLLVGASLIGVAYILHSAVTMYFVLIPITGRSGSTLNPELVIAGLTCLICFVVGNYLIPLLLTVRRPWMVVRGLALAHIVAAVLIISTPLGFPYSAGPKHPALQRFFIYHTEQILHGVDGSVIRNASGAFILPMDRNKLKYVAADVPELKNAATADCNNGLLCQFPLYNSRYVNPAKTSVWLPLPPPQIHYPTQLQLLESAKYSPFGRRLQFKLKGPDHMTLVISPRAGIRLANWTLGYGRTPASYVGRAG